LKGPGIHQTFGWKPILKKTEMGACDYNIDVSMLDFNTLHLMCFNVVSVELNRILMRFNAATGQMDSTYHRYGRNGGVNYDTSGQESNQDTSCPLWNYINGRFHIFIEVVGNVLIMQNQGIAWVDTDNFMVVEGGAIFKGAAPYLIMNISGYMVNHTYELQVFRSVFTF